MESLLFFRTPFRFSESKFYGTLTLLLFSIITTTNSLFGQTLIGPSELLANTESSYYISDPSVTGNWEVNGSATVSTNLVNQNAIKVKANNYCYGRFTVIVKIGDKYLHRQVDIIKNLPPIFTSGASTATLSCNSTLEDFDNYKPTAKDIDGNAVDVELVDMVPMQMGKCQSILTWQATDKCGNKAFFKQTIEILGNDTQAPVFDQTTLVKTFYDCDKIPRTFPVPKATDNCVNPVMVKLVRREVSERIRSSIACMSYFEILTWEATDVCGNKRQADQTICVVDNVPPVFVSSTLAPITVFQCGFDYDKYQPKATDNCSNPVMIMAVDFQYTTTGVGRRTVVITWEATDMCGNATRAKQTFFVIDQTPPRINRGLPLPAITVECNDLLDNIQIPSGFDDCGDPVEVILASRRVIVAGNCNNRVIELTWKATDASGNMSFATQIVKFKDNTPPIVICPAAMTVSCATQVPAPNIAAVVATDNCDDDVAKAFVNDVITNQTCTNRYTITRTYRGTDDCGNATNCTQIITVNDQTSPTITCPGTITVSCANLVPAANTTLPTASDNCGGNVVISHVGDAAVGGQCANRFNITRTYRATDACGNTATCTQTIIVNDITAPVITATGTTLTLGCNPTAAQINAALGTATATDACGNVTPTATDGTIVVNGCGRSQTRTWTAVDACGNAAIPVSRTVTWTFDNVAPLITATGTTLTLGCNPTAAQINAALGTATATDACGNVTPVATDGPIVVNGCGRSQTRTWNATDACGNAATPVTRTVTWTLDVTPPVFTFCPPGADLGCNPRTIPGPGAATATDLCDGVVITSVLGTVVTNGCSRSQTRTYTATDACGNTATCLQIFTWSDNSTLPVITATGTTLTLGCNPTAAQINAALGTATVAAACGNVTLVATDGAIVVNGCGRSQTRTWTATDVCGNQATPVSRTVTWTLDNIAPVITATGTTLTLGCNPTAAQINAALGTATAADACGNVTPTATDGPIVVNGCGRSQTRTWNAADACGNQATPVTRTVTWTFDQTPPVVVASGNSLTLGCNPTAATINAALGTATASDNCNLQTFTSTDGAVIRNGCNRSQTRTWTATDACGNQATATRTATWIEDLTPPVLVGLPANLNITVGCNSIPTVPNVTATDACGNARVTFNEVRNPGACLRTITRTWFATDACGNVSATVTQTITVTEQFTQNFTQQDIDRLISPASVCCEEDAIARLRAANINLIVTVCGVPIPVAPTLCVDMNGCSNGNRGSTYRVFFRWQLASPCNPNVLLVDIQSKFVNINPNSANCPPCGTIRMCDPNGGIRCDNILPLQAPNLSNKMVEIVKDKANDISLSDGFKFNDYSNGIKAKDFKVSAFPNPTTGDINFNITTPIKGDLRLKLFDVSGKQIGLIVRQDLEGGFENQINYTIPATVSSGLIFYTITVGEEVKSGKLMYMKN